MSELVMEHNSVTDWLQAECWSEYLRRAQEIIGAPITHLDERDPVKRKASDLSSLGAYITTLKPGSSSRWIFGKFASLNVDFMLRIYQQPSEWQNSIRWHFPQEIWAEGEKRARLELLFSLGNKLLRPFYSYADLNKVVMAKSRESGAIDLKAELLGMFWMTYFDSRYVNFFGREKFEKFPKAVQDSEGGLTLILHESPFKMSDEYRTQSEVDVAKDSFVNPGDILGKRPGIFALTFAHLRSAAHKRES